MRVLQVLLQLSACELARRRSHIDRLVAMQRSGDQQAAIGDMGELL
jgi:hypothetical protein